MQIRSKLNRLIWQFLNDPNYAITHTGRVFNVNTGRELGYTKASEASKRRKGYLYINYRGHEIKLHRIIYRAFHGPLKQGYVVHHVDGNGLNNHVANLVQTSQRINSNY